MPVYQAVVLAIIQGVAEFLPISSTAHLALFPWLAGWQDPGLTFDIALHAGTLVAVVVYFWRTWADLVRAAAGYGRPKDDSRVADRRLFWLLVIGTIPGGVAGLLFEKKAETVFRSPLIIGVALILLALFMWLGERQQNHDEGLRQVTLRDSIWVGVSQGFAVIPGVSRSGVTMSTGLFRRMTRETAAQFSFLLSTPIIAGAALKKGLELRHEGLAPEMRLPFLLGVIVSAAVGYLVIAWLIRYLQTHTFKVFIVYRVALGIAVLALYFIKGPTG